MAEERVLQIRRISNQEGLSQSSVFAIEQDARGFIWFGTQDGLQRYDGERFTIYRSPSHRTEGLPHSTVMSLMLGRGGRLWIGTFRGLARFDPADESFERFTVNLDDGDTEPSISSLVESLDGSVWAGTQRHGLLRIQPSNDGPEAAEIRSYRHHPQDASAFMPHDRVWSLLEDPDGTLWIGTEGGLVRYEPSTGRHEVFSPQPQDPFSLPDARVLSLHRDRRGDLWVGTGDGLARFESTSRRFHVLRHDPDDANALAHPVVRAIFEDRRGDLWIGTGGGGLDRFDRRRGAFEHHHYDLADNRTLSHNEVWTLSEDRSGLLWVGTAYGGANVVDSRPKFRHRQPGGTFSSVVLGLLVDHRGDLWIGVDGEGLFRSEGRRDAAEPYPLEVEDLRRGRPWHLFEDRQRRLWIGTERALYRLVDGQITTFAHQLGLQGSLPPGGVRRILQDAEGNVWTAHFGGGLGFLAAQHLDAWEVDLFQSFRHRREDGESLISDHVYTLYEDRQARLWVGTSEGLERYLGEGRFEHFQSRPNDDSSLAGRAVRSIHQDVQGRLWVGTDHGLDLLEDIEMSSAASRFRHFDYLHGLPNDTIYALLEDSTGRLWMSTNRGLARLDLAQDQILSFDPMDGLQGWEFNGGSAALGPDGEMYFGGTKGYNVFHPSEVDRRSYIPPVVFTGYRLDHQEVALGGQLLHGRQVEIGPEISTATFEFASLDFIDPGSNRYRYRLEGLNRSWVELGHRNEVTFSHLVPGTYRLEVQGSNSDGVWNGTATELRLSIRPAWWQTWWANLIYILAACLVLSVLLWQYWRRELLRQEINRVLRTSQQRLELALRGSGDGLWDWNIETGSIYRSRVARLLGLDAAEMPPNHEFRRQRIHQEDSERVEKALQDHLAGRSQRYEAEYRLRHKDGTWRWILDRGVVVRRDEEGKPTRMAGTFKDIHRLKTVESKLRLWATVFEVINEGVMIIDTENTILAVNSAFCSITGFDRDAVVGNPTQILETAEGSPELYGDIRQALAEQGSWQGEVRQTRASGEDFLAWADFNPVMDEDGETTHFVCVVSDITQRKKSEEELRYLASFDVVTGLPNRVHFLQHLEKALGQAEEDERQLAVLFGDLDHFKSVNDTLGHAVGDHLLQEAGRRLQASVRRHDLVARLGGDEFTVLLRDFDHKNAVLRIADRILEAFAQPFELGDRSMKISTSFGISLFPADGQSAEELLEKADVAMYEAKGAGRNQYRFYRDEMSTQPRGHLLARRTRPSS